MIVEIQKVTREDFPKIIQFIEKLPEHPNMRWSHPYKGRAIMVFVETMLAFCAFEPWTKENLAEYVKKIDKDEKTYLVLMDNRVIGLLGFWIGSDTLIDPPIQLDFIIPDFDLSEDQKREVITESLKVYGEAKRYILGRR